MLPVFPRAFLGKYARDRAVHRLLISPPPSLPAAVLADSHADADETDEYIRGNRLLSFAIARERDATAEAEAEIASTTAATAAAELVPTTKVQRAYVNIDLRAIEQLVTMPFHSDFDAGDEAHRLLRTVASVVDYILSIYDEERLGLDPDAWVPGW